jgi:hypothetical protein
MNGQDTEYGGLANSQSVREEIHNVMTKGNNFRHAYGFSNKNRNILGSPFYHSYWQNGKLLLKNYKDTIASPDVKYKFDALNNELWIYSKKDSIIAQNKDVLYFEITNDINIEKFVKDVRFKNDESTPRFYKAIYLGQKIRFYHDIRKVFKPANYIDKGMYSSGDPNDRIIEKYQYYIRFSDQDLVATNNTAKAIVKAFWPAYRSSAKAYMKQCKLKGELSDEDISLFLAYMETIMHK